MHLVQTQYSQEHMWCRIYQTTISGQHDKWCGCISKAVFKVVATSSFQLEWASLIQGGGVALVADSCEGPEPEERRWVVTWKGIGISILSSGDVETEEEAKCVDQEWVEAISTIWLDYLTISSSALLPNHGGHYNRNISNSVMEPHNSGHSIMLHTPRILMHLSWIRLESLYLAQGTDRFCSNSARITTMPGWVEIRD